MTYPEIMHQHLQNIIQCEIDYAKDIINCLDCKMILEFISALQEKRGVCLYC